MTLLLKSHEPVVREVPGIVLPPPSFPFRDRMALGAYDRFNPAIEAMFSLSLPPGPLSLFLVSFPNAVTVQYFHDWLELKPYEIAPIDGLLAVGGERRYFELQERKTIISLRSSDKIPTDHRFPYLGKDTWGRCIDLDNFGGPLKDCAFLCTLKIPNPKLIGLPLGTVLVM